MISCEQQTIKGGCVLFYVNASFNFTVLQTETKDNADVIVWQLKTHLKKIIIGLINRSLLHNITSDIKLYDQIIFFFFFFFFFFLS